MRTARSLATCDNCLQFVVDCECCDDCGWCDTHAAHCGYGADGARTIVRPGDARSYVRPSIVVTVDKAAGGLDSTCEVIRLVPIAPVRRRVAVRRRL